MLEAILQMVMGLEEDTTSTNGATTNSIKNENGVVHAGAVDPEEAAYAVSHLLLPSEASANDSIGIENRSKVDEYIAEPRNESSQLDASAILLGEEHTTSLASVAAHQLFVTDLTEHIEPKHEQQTAVTDHVHAGPPPLDADLGAGDTEVVNNVAAAMFTTPHPPSTQLPVMMSVATTFVGDRTPFVAPPMTMPVVYLTNGAATTVNSSLSYNCPEAEVSITQDTDGRGHLQNRNENPNQTEDKKRLSSITNTTCSATKRRRYSSSTRKSLPRWNDMLFQIILYRIDHGHCMVPFKTGGELGKWVAIQRAQYAKLQQHTMADPASMVAADSPSGGIGDVQSKDIEEAIDSTTCNDGMQVDSTDNNTHLAARDTGAIEVQDSAESLNIERANVLSSLGFVWDVIQADNDARWKKRFEELVKYKAVHGHCNVPQSTELGKWVKMQRENKHETDLKKSGKTPIRKKPKPCLSDKRIAKLESLGFQWRVAKPAVGWERRFEQLLDYKVKHGDCNVPQSYPLDKPFGRWVMKQRCQQSLKLRGEKSQLTNERERKLTELGFSWVAPGFSKKSLVQPENDDDSDDEVGSNQGDTEVNREITKDVEPQLLCVTQSVIQSNDDSGFDLAVTSQRDAVDSGLHLTPTNFQQLQSQQESQPELEKQVEIMAVQENAAISPQLVLDDQCQVLSDKQQDVSSLRETLDESSKHEETSSNKVQLQTHEVITQEETVITPHQTSVPKDSDAYPTWSV